jgi:hypothetical protein
MNIITIIKEDLERAEGTAKRYKNDTIEYYNDNAVCWSIDRVFDIDFAADFSKRFEKNKGKKKLEVGNRVGVYINEDTI